MAIAAEARATPVNVLSIGAWLFVTHVALSLRAERKWPKTRAIVQWVTRGRAVVAP